MNNQHSSPYPPLVPLPSTRPPYPSLLLPFCIEQTENFKLWVFHFQTLSCKFKFNTIYNIYIWILSVLKRIKKIFSYSFQHFFTILFFFYSQKLPFYHEDFSQTNTIMLIHTQFSEYWYMFRYNQFTYWIWGVGNNDVKFSLMLLHVFKSITNMQWQFWALKTNGHLWQILFGHLNNFLLGL